MRPGKVRIIGGHWRGRRLPVADVDGLRPTPDRVRETLFNWLQPVIEGAACLDLFAGTGALGLEALSRGAARSILVEQHHLLAKQIEDNLKLLEAQDARLARSDALRWLARNREKFDIVFLDPPFGEGLIDKSCTRLRETGCLKPGALVYMEAERGLAWPAGFEIKKQGLAGQVQYALASLI